MNLRYPKLFISFFTLLLFSSSSCKKFVEVDAPVTSVNSKNVFNSNETATAVLTGIYIDLSRTIWMLSLTPALSSDEITLYGGSSSSNTSYIPIYLNLLDPKKLDLSDFCSSFYPKIYTLNLAIESLGTAKNLTQAVKTQLLGEAYFMRAFYYFYLVNFYGDVPLSISTDYTKNGTLSRSLKSKVYELIIDDLMKAKTFLSAQYLTGNALTPYPTGVEERVRPTKWAAEALLARVNLYNGYWKNAEEEASLVINNVSLYHLTSLDKTFLKNNAESIWQLQPVDAFLNTIDATNFIFLSTRSCYLSDDLVNSFEVNDKRKSNWVNQITIDGVSYPYAFKYKVDVGDHPVDEYTVVLRLAEQYLIRAEARAELGDLSGAEDDLNIIRARAGLGNVSIKNKVDILAAILHERQIEFFTELGHRWLDLKRTKNIDNVMSIVCLKKGGIWNTNKQLYPFSSKDIQYDPNLIQNPGYQ